MSTNDGMQNLIKVVNEVQVNSPPLQAHTTAASFPLPQPRASQQARLTPFRRFSKRSHPRCVCVAGPSRQQPAVLLPLPGHTAVTRAPAGRVEEARPGPARRVAQPAGFPS